MEKRIRKFSNPGEADAADRTYYQSLTPEQRIDILLELVQRGNGESSEGFKRVCRVIKREEG